MVIFLASMQMIDTQLYESATLDGASILQQFRYITLPCLHNTISMVIVIGFISGIKGFGTVWAMTQGGPVDSTELVMVYIWRNAFEDGQMSKTLAGSIIFGLVITIISILMNQIRDRSINNA
jgi:ABC-type sugar transport system permease subunit